MTQLLAAVVAILFLKFLLLELLFLELMSLKLLFQNLFFSLQFRLGFCHLNNETTSCHLRGNFSNT